MSALMEEAEWLTNNSEEGSVMEDAALVPGARTELQRAIAAYHALGEEIMDLVDDALFGRGATRH